MLKQNGGVINKLEVAIFDAKTHSITHGRDTVIFVPKDLYTQCYGIFVKEFLVKGPIVQLDGIQCRLAVEGELVAKQYDSLFILNPQDFDEAVLNSVMKAPVDGGLVVCVKI